MTSVLPAPSGYILSIDPATNERIAMVASIVCLFIREYTKEKKKINRPTLHKESPKRPLKNNEKRKYILFINS